MIEPEQGTTTFSFLINLDSIEISQDQWDRVEGKGEEIKISTTLMMNFVKKENEEWEGGGIDVSSLSRGCACSHQWSPK